MTEMSDAIASLREQHDPSMDRKLGTVMGLLMSARAAEDAAMRIVSELKAESPVVVSEPAEEGICEHPGDKRKLISTMGDSPPQEFCEVCGERLN